MVHSKRLSGFVDTDEKFDNVAAAISRRISQTVSPTAVRPQQSLSPDTAAKESLSMTPLTIGDDTFFSPRHPSAAPTQSAVNSPCQHKSQPPMQSTPYHDVEPKWSGSQASNQESPDRPELE